MGGERKMTAKTKGLVIGLAAAAVVLAGLLIWAVTISKPEPAPEETDPVTTTTLPLESTEEATGETTNSSVETTDSTESTKPEETTEATKPVEMTQPEETTEATKPVDTTQPEETIETTDPEETTEATKPVTVTQPEETTEVTQPEEATKPVTEPEETTEATEETSQPATQPQETEPETTNPKETQAEDTEPEVTEPETTEPEETTLPEVEPTEPEEMETVPEVTVPQETDPVTGEETGITFPSQIPGHSLVIEKLAPYSGMYVEDGTNAQIKDVAMLLVKNTGSETLEYARITVQYGEEELLFQVSALPAGERAVVQAQQRKTVPQGKPTGCTALVAEGNTAGSFAPEVKVTDNGDGSITVENLTEQPIPAVRVFYKYYMEDADVFVGGITFTLKLTNLKGKAVQTLRPSHYSKDSSQIVTVAIYDAEQ